MKKFQVVILLLAATALLGACEASQHEGMDDMASSSMDGSSGSTSDAGQDAGSAQDTGDGHGMDGMNPDAMKAMDM